MEIRVRTIIDLALQWRTIAGVFSAALAAWITVMMLDNAPPYIYDAEHSYVIPSVAEEGAQITVKWRVTRINRICPGSNHRILFDPKTNVILVSYDTVLAADRNDITPDGYLNRTFLLPRGGILPPGPIGYRARVGYECNLLQRFWPLFITTPDLFFTVEEK